MLRKLIPLLFLYFPWKGTFQEIKTIQLRPKNTQEYSPIVKLGAILELSFDDLDADNKSYQYKIEHMTSSWESSKLSSNQYIDGFNQNYIRNVKNSFNTLQNYTHYTVDLPNEYTKITKSGNYLISILDEDNKIVFSRKCTFYEPKTTVGVSVVRSMNTKNIDEEQTVHIKVNYNNLKTNNPAQEIKAVILQNNNYNIKIDNLKPQFYQKNLLIYNYNNKSNFWGGNEFRSFDNKNMMNSNFKIAHAERNIIWNNYLRIDEPRRNRLYTYNPDINGQFVIRTLNANNTSNEADYVNIHFSLYTYEPLQNKDIYVYGAFNNFNLTEDNKMSFNATEGTYNTSIKLKQGFYNYSYATVDKQGNVNLNEIDGSHYQTENEYSAIIYYKPFGALYEQAIGFGKGHFNQEQ